MDLVKKAINVFEEIIDQILADINGMFDDAGFKKFEKLNNGRYLDMIRIMTKRGVLEPAVSKAFLKGFNAFLRIPHNSNKILYFYKNSNATTSDNEMVHSFFSNEILVDMFFFHFLNVHLHESGRGKEIDKNLVNTVFYIIAMYTLISGRRPIPEDFLVVFSIVLILADGNTGRVNAHRFGTVPLSNVFNEILKKSRNSTRVLDRSVEKYLRLLKERKLLYTFFNSLEDKNVPSVPLEYMTAVSRVALGEAIYDEKMLIDYHYFFTRFAKEEYETEVSNKSEFERLWFKDAVLNNLENSNEALHDETFGFLKHVGIDNWHQDSELRSVLKNFLVRNFEFIMDYENAADIFLGLLEREEKFEVDYTAGDFGKKLIEAFLSMDEEDVLLLTLMKHLDRIFNKKELALFKTKLYEKINPENLNEYQYMAIEDSSELLKMNKTLLGAYFNKLLDVRENIYAYRLMKRFVESNKRIKRDFKIEMCKKLKDIKDSMEDSNIEEAIVDAVAGVISALQCEKEANQSSS